ncbi:MAG TPA: DUF3175 domain-containing protein [Pseudolabrys sp.]|nr:DUF3175 domain-containing protein [Pseudolabrys sp.]
MRSQARARSRSTGHSRRRKAKSCRWAMSMLTFFINRGGRGLSREPQAETGKGQGQTV